MCTFESRPHNSKMNANDVLLFLKNEVSFALDILSCSPADLELSDLDPHPNPPAKPLGWLMLPWEEGNPNEDPSIEV